MTAQWKTLTHQLIDTHCHLGQYPDRDTILAQVIDSGMRVTVMTESPNEFCATQEWLGNSETIQPALGLIPHRISELAAECEQFCDQLSETRYVGEIGLDYVTECTRERQQQRKVFERILTACAPYGDKVLSVHSRRAAEDVITMIGNDFAGTVILHWFSGRLALLESVTATTYFSINTAMIRSRHGKALVSVLPPERILTETDGPYVQVGGQPALPTDIRGVIESLAHAWKRSVNDVVHQISTNYQAALSRGDAKKTANSFP